jgi:hypothetical protein
VLSLQKLDAGFGDRFGYQYLMPASRFLRLRGGFHVDFLHCGHALAELNRNAVGGQDDFKFPITANRSAKSK